MFSNSLRMAKLDRNMSDLWQIVCKNIILTLVRLLVLLCELFINAQSLITLRCVLNESRDEQAVCEFPSPVLISWTHIDIHTFFQYQYCINTPVWMHIRTFSQGADFLNGRTSEADSCRTTSL
jgi:hypothetical protein